MLSQTLLRRCWQIVAVTMLFLVSGCATQITETPAPVTRTRVPLGGFERVVLFKSKIADKYAGQGPNIKAANKIDEHLENGLRSIFDQLEVKGFDETEADDYSTSSANEVLLIKPYIKQIKFIGGAARFWVGAMAGSSVVIMDVAYQDAASGEKLSEPGFQRVAKAFSGAFGIADNRMLNAVAQDVINYTSANR
jgi:hypothetical protein